MNTEQELWETMIKHLPPNDPSHDPEHIRRVLNAAKMIQEKEGGDPDIIIPAAIFHDVINYAKDDPRNKLSTEESAQFAKNVLSEYSFYTPEKIDAVAQCILECSWSKGLQASSLESQILQDADRLEAIGAIAIMRTFSSGGQMNRGLYNPQDPFCEKQVPEGVTYSFDLMYQRLLKVYDTLHTQTAKDIGLRRKQFLELFINELRKEFTEVNVLN